MAGSVFTVAKGRGNELHERVVNEDPADAALIVVLLQESEDAAALLAHANLHEILSVGDNVEANFTNYARYLFTASDLAATQVDEVSGGRFATIPDPIWLSAGGATNNTLSTLLVCYTPERNGGSDVDVVPVVAMPFFVATDGNDLTAFIDPTGYFEAI